MDRNDLKDGEQQQQANASVESLLHELYYAPRHASAYTSIGNVYRAAKNNYQISRETSSNAGSNDN